MTDHPPSFQYAGFNETPGNDCTELYRAAIAMHLAPPPEELCERLLLAVKRAASNNASSMAALRAAVEEFTVTLKNDGATPEAVLITLKAVINNRAFPSVDAREPYSSGDPLRQKISTWSIKEFFREQTA